jgi:hypothetical protein
MRRRHQTPTRSLQVFDRREVYQVARRIPTQLLEIDAALVPCCSDVVM